MVKELWTLSEALKSADPDKVKESIHRSIDRVDLYWGHVPGKVTHKYPLERGVITLSPSLALLYNTSSFASTPPSRNNVSAMSRRNASLSAAVGAGIGYNNSGSDICLSACFATPRR